MALSGEGSLDQKLDNCGVLIILLSMLVMSFLCGGLFDFGVNSLILQLVCCGLGVLLGGRLFKGGVTHRAVYLFLPWLVYVWCNFYFLEGTPWFGGLIVASHLAAFGVCWFVTTMSERSTEYVFTGLKFLTCVVLLFALLQVVIGGRWHPIFGEDFARPQYAERLNSVFAMPTSFACYMLIVLPVSLMHFINKPKWRVVNAMLTVFVMWGLVSSESRASILVAVPVIIACGLLSGGARMRWAHVLGWLLTYGGIYLAVTLVDGGGRFEQLITQGGESGRKLYYAAAAEMFIQSPWFGKGVGNFQLYWDRVLPTTAIHSEAYLHSDSLEVLAETGIVGALLIFGALAFVGVRSLGVFWRVKEFDDAGLRARIAFCSLLAAGGNLLVNHESKLLVIFMVIAVYMGILLRYLAHHSGEKSVMVRSHKVSDSIVLAALVVISVSCIPRAVATAKHSHAGQLYKNFIYAHLDGRAGPLEVLKEVEKSSLAAQSWDNNFMPAFQFAAHTQVSHLYYPNAPVADIVNAAEKNFEIATKLCPVNWRLWTERGRVLMYDPDRVLEARQYFEKAVDLAPKNYNARYQYAEYLCLYGEPTDLRKVEQLAIELEFADPEVKLYPSSRTMLSRFVDRLEKGR